MNFNITPSLPATPFVSETLTGSQQIAITFPEGKPTAIFVQQSADGGTTWQSLRSISPTPSAHFSVITPSPTTALRILLSTRPTEATATAIPTPSPTPGGDYDQKTFDFNALTAAQKSQLAQIVKADTDWSNPKNAPAYRTVDEDYPE